MNNTTNALILSCYKLVPAVLASVLRGLDHPCSRAMQEEMLEVGYLALCEVAQRFDPAVGVKFSTFARHRIWGAMMDALRSTEHNSDLDETTTSDGDFDNVSDTDLSATEQVDRLLAEGHLTQQEERIIHLFYGLDGVEYSVADIARLYDCSDQYIRRLRARAITKLRAVA